MMVTEIAVGHQHLELGIEDQKRLQQVLLGPKPELVHHPMTPVIERQKDVVDIHDHDWLETHKTSKNRWLTSPPVFTVCELSIRVCHRREAGRRI